MSIFITSTSSSMAQEAKETITVNTGKFKVSLLSEGQQNGKSSILIGATPEMLQKYVPDGTFPNATNAFLIQTGDKNILIDTGFGSKLFNNLQSLGILAEQIDIVLLTHMHGDHIGGMLRDGQIAFPNATIYLAQPEHDYWTDVKLMNQMPENRRGGFQKAQDVIAAYKNKLKLFQPEMLGTTLTAILPGIYGIAAYGHTPGHTGFLLESDNEKMLIWGDLTHAMAIQMPYPEIAVTYDVDPQLAINYRKQILEFVCKNNIAIAGMHIAFPGMGKISVNSNKTGYLFMPSK